MHSITVLNLKSIYSEVIQSIIVHDFNLAKLNLFYYSPLTRDYPRLYFLDLNSSAPYLVRVLQHWTSYSALPLIDRARN